jgi:hypothetical protein
MDSLCSTLLYSGDEHIKKALFSRSRRAQMPSNLVQM